MYDFSGVIYRLWAECGIIFCLGLLCILLEKPWQRPRKRSKGYFLGILLMMIALGLGTYYMSRINHQDISVYQGEFIASHRNSRVAPPLPFTFEYVFWDGEGKKPVFYLDIFSKKKIYFPEFIEGCEYVIYFDELTHLIVNVEEIE